MLPSSQRMQSYEMVKEAILRRYAINQETHIASDSNRISRRERSHTRSMEIVLEITS